MRLFRKVVLPIVWVAIFSTIAVSLAVLAFGDDPPAPGSGLKPTGALVPSNVTVARGTIENTLQAQGTIKVDPPVAAKATHDGIINHYFVPEGAKVKVGDALFQIRSEADAISEDGDDEKAKKPPTKFHNVVATTAGRVGAFTKELGDSVAKGDAVTTIRRQTFQAFGTISALDQYRLLDPPDSATVSIPGGPAPFACTDLIIGGTAETPPSTGEENAPTGYEMDEGMGGEGAGASVTCRVPEDVRVFDQLAMTMSIDAGRVEEVLVVPVTAVQGLVKRGTIWVLTDGEPVERKVRLGASDGKFVEIRNGAKEGEPILEFVPGGSPAGDEGDPYGEFEG